MNKFLKKNWFVSILVVVFAGISIFYIYDTNKGKLKGKSSGGESVVYEINGEDKTVSQFYDDLYELSGGQALYQSFMKAVVSQSVETTDDMKTIAENQASSVISSYSSTYPTTYQTVLDGELKSMGYSGYSDLSTYLIDYQKVLQIAGEYADAHFDDLQIRNVSYILIKPEDSSNFSEETTEDEQARKDAVDKALSDGMTFAEAAASYSEDSSTASSGGVLGTLDANTTSLDSAFQTASLALKEGEISDWVFSSNFGWFKIQCNASTPDGLVKAYVEQNGLEDTSMMTTAEVYYSLLQSYDQTLMPVALYEKGVELGLTFNDENAESKLRSYMGIED